MRSHHFAATIAAGAFALTAQAAVAQPLVSSDWLRSHLNDPKLVVLDLRPAAQYATGHIPGAVGADYEKSGWRAVTQDGASGALPPIDRISAVIGNFGVADDSHAVIVGDDFGAMARVYWTFKVLGHQAVSVLDGGWDGWRANPADKVATAPVQPRHVTFAAHYDPSIRAELSEVEKAVATGSETLVDARPPAQWNGTAKTPVVKTLGHLPGAVWVDQTEALQSGAKLKSKSDLKKLFAKVGDGKAVTYCNTGHLAATDWFVLSEVLNKRNTKMYDGSMSQWAADGSRPVVVETP